MAEANGKTVVVTGAGGFIGCHVVKQCLDAGYIVRGTVRDRTNSTKNGFLMKLAEGKEDRLHLYSADLETQGSFDDVIQGADFVIHTAAVVRLKAKNPQKEIIDPTVKGLENVFNSINRALTVKKVVLTSSDAAIYEGPPNNETPFTEADWNMQPSGPYYVAKTQSERRAWEIYRSQPEGISSRWELTTILPTYVLGEAFTREHIRTSPQIVQQLLNGSFPLAPRLYLPVVDVRDVARAHVVALQEGQSHGKRYILNCEGLWMLEMSKILREKYGSAYRLPKSNMPKLMLYLIALFHPTVDVAWVKKEVGKTVKLDNSASKRELGLVYRSPKEMIVACAESILANGLLHVK